MAHYVLVCGGGDITNDVAGLAMDNVLTFLKHFYGADMRLLHGNAPGIDALAAEIGRHLEIPTKEYPEAGIDQNRRMCNLLLAWEQKGHSVEVIAFPGGSGTAHLTDFAERLGLNVTYIPLDLPQPTQESLPGVGSQ